MDVGKRIIPVYTRSDILDRAHLLCSTTAFKLSKRIRPYMSARQRKSINQFRFNSGARLISNRRILKKLTKIFKHAHLQSKYFDKCNDLSELESFINDDKYKEIRVLLIYNRNLKFLIEKYKNMFPSPKSS